MRTTIELTDIVKSVYTQLTTRYGVRSAVSAGILLLSKLSSQEREDAVDEANGVPGKHIEIHTKPTQEDMDRILDSVRELAEMEGLHLKYLYPKEEPVNESWKIIKKILADAKGGIRILSPEEQKIMEELRKAVGPEPAETVKKKAK